VLWCEAGSQILIIPYLLVSNRTMINLKNTRQLFKDMYANFDIFDIWCNFFYSGFCCSFLGNISFVATLKFEKKIKFMYVCMFGITLYAIFSLMKITKITYKYSTIVIIFIKLKMAYKLCRNMSLKSCLLFF